MVGYLCFSSVLFLTFYLVLLFGVYYSVSQFFLTSLISMNWAKQLLLNLKKICIVVPDDCMAAVGAGAALGFLKQKAYLPFFTVIQTLLLKKKFSHIFVTITLFCMSIFLKC